MSFERWSSLLVRYWAVNMTMIHNRSNNWPGFSYSDKEKDEMREMGSQVPRSEFYFFTAAVTVIAIAVFAVIVWIGMNSLIAVIGGEQNMPKTPAALFFFSLALEVVVSLTLGLPAAMLVSAALVGALRGVPDDQLPDRATTSHYFHKLWFQIARMTMIMLALVLPMWIFVPNDSKFMVLVRMVVPLLSPVVAVLSTVYYFSSKSTRAVSTGAAR